MVQSCYLRLYLGIDTVSCHLIAMDGKGGNGLKLEKRFQLLMLCLQKLPKNYHVVLPDEICYISSS